MATQKVRSNILPSDDLQCLLMGGADAGMDALNTLINLWRDKRTTACIWFDFISILG